MALSTSKDEDYVLWTAFLQYILGVLSPSRDPVMPTPFTRGAEEAEQILCRWGSGGEEQRLHLV